MQKQDKQKPAAASSQQGKSGKSLNFILPLVVLA